MPVAAWMEFERTRTRMKEASRPHTSTRPTARYTVRSGKASRGDSDWSTAPPRAPPSAADTRAAATPAKNHVASARIGRLVRRRSTRYQCPSSMKNPGRTTPHRGAGHSSARLPRAVSNSTTVRTPAGPRTSRSTSCHRGLRKPSAVPQIAGKDDVILVGPVRGVQVKHRLRLAGLVRVGEHLVVVAEVPGVGGGGADQPERGGLPAVDAVTDLSEAVVHREVGDAPLDHRDPVRQEHPLVVARPEGGPARAAQAGEQPVDDIVERR